jgi:hypothetical protein
MKKDIYFTLILMLILTGCVPSLHQLWTDKRLVYDEAINGKYQESDTVWEFVGNPERKSYGLTIYEKDNQISKLTAHLVDVNGQRFLDLYPSDEAEIEGGDWLKFHLVPAHLFLRVEQTEPALALAAMNPNAVDKLLAETPGLIKHERIKDDRVILTDSPEKLQQFLIAGIKIEGFFDEPQVLPRVD